jgi:hypothetical protein
MIRDFNLPLHFPIIEGKLYVYSNSLISDDMFQLFDKSKLSRLGYSDLKIGDKHHLLIELFKGNVYSFGIEYKLDDDSHNIWFLGKYLLISNTKSALNVNMPNYVDSFDDVALIELDFISKKVSVSCSNGVLNIGAIKKYVINTASTACSFFNYFGKSEVFPDFSNKDAFNHHFANYLKRVNDDLFGGAIDFERITSAFSDMCSREFDFLLKVTRESSHLLPNGSVIEPDLYCDDDDDDYFDDED